MRIAAGGFQHESHSFAPMPTRWQMDIAKLLWGVGLFLNGLTQTVRLVRVLLRKRRRRPAIKAE